MIDAELKIEISSVSTSALHVLKIIIKNCLGRQNMINMSHRKLLRKRKADRGNAKYFYQRSYDTGNDQTGSPFRMQHQGKRYKDGDK